MKLLKHRIQSFSAVQIIFFAYLVGVIVCTAVLVLPVSHKQGAELSAMDAFFVATSAISVTGLSTVNIVETFSMFGQMTLLLAIQFGGIGIMTLGTLLWVILGQNVTLSQRRLLMIDQNQTHLSGLVRLLQIIVKMVIFIELSGTILFGFYFKWMGYFDGWMQSFYHAFFHTLSTYTNAGFDLFGDSLVGFYDDYVVQSVSMILIVLGSIGFPVLVELWHYVFGKTKHFRFSLFSKITFICYTAIFAIGAIGVWVMERADYLRGQSWHSQLFFSLFNSVTARSSGLATMDMAELGSGTQFFISNLMFIGGSPSSTGGGIRTTTFAVLILTLICVARSRKEVTAFGRTLKQEDVLKSFFVFALGVFLVVCSAVAINAVDDDKFSLQAIIFEVTSAFGTCGLSLGITPDLSNFSKIMIIILMFIGRIGLLTLLNLFHKDKQRTLKVRYPEEKIIIG